MRQALLYVRQTGKRKTFPIHYAEGDTRLQYSMNSDGKVLGSKEARTREGFALATEGFAVGGAFGLPLIKSPGR